MNQHAVELGKLGGKAGKGQAKARTSAQAKAAANARWGNPKNCINTTGTFTCSICGLDMRDNSGLCLQSK